MDAKTTFQRWAEVRGALLAALDKLTDEQLDFRPHEGLWTLHETAVHVAGTEDGWLRCYTANQWHEAPPQAKNYPTVASVKALLDEQHARTLVQFAVEPDRLFQQVYKLPWGAETTMDWAVWHVLEHEIHHRGEIFLMLGLLGMEAPDV